MPKKSLRPWIADLLGYALDLALPPRCASCKQYLGLGHKGPLCKRCRGDIHPITGPFCTQCGAPFRSKTGPNHLCGACITEPPPWDEAQSLFYYKGTIRELIHNLKFKKRPSATFALSYLARQIERPTNWEYDLICPMPLSSARLRQRGFNQCLELAKSIFVNERKKIDPFLLVKASDNPPQSGLSKKERIKNVKGAFRTGVQGLSDKKVLLFDDIYTTGATAKEAASVLRQGGVRRIYLFTLARA